MKRFISLAIIVSPLLLYSQSPGIIWENILGGGGNEYPNSIIQTSDGGYLMTAVALSGGEIGAHCSYGSSDIWAVKFNSGGEVTWQQCYGGSNAEYELFSLYAGNDTYGLEDGDGNFIILGSTKSNDLDVSGNHGGYDVWLIKIDPDGVLLQQRCLGGNKDDFGKCMVPSPEGGYIISGWSKSSGSGDVTDTSPYLNNINGWIIKVDASFEPVWNKLFGGSKEDLFYTMLQDGEDIVCAGTTLSNDGDISGFHQALIGNYQDVWVVKCNSSGEMIWTDCYGSTRIENHVHDIIKTSNGYLFISSTNGNDGDVTGMHDTNNFEYSFAHDTWVAEIDFNGTLLWQKTLGSYGTNSSGGITKDASGNLIVATTADKADGMVSNVSGLNNDIWLTKIDSAGRFLIWEGSYGDAFSEYPYDVKTDADGNIILVADWVGDAGILKLDDPVSDAKIFTEFLPTLEYCPADAIDINYVVSETFGPGNIFTAQLSDPTGSFSTFTNIGSVASQTSGTISAGLPSVSGTSYRVRVVGSVPASTGIDNGDDIFILCQDISVLPPSATTTTITLSWHAADCALGYEVKYSMAGTSSWTPVITNDTVYTITDLLPSTGYKCKMRVICDNSPKLASEWANNSVITPPERYGAFNEIRSDIFIYPNPANDLINIELPNDNSPTENYTLNICDMTGNIIKTYPLNKEKSIDIRSLAAGMYLFEFLSGNNSVQIEKIFVQ